MGCRVVWARPRPGHFSQKVERCPRFPEIYQMSFRGGFGFFFQGDFCFLFLFSRRGVLGRNLDITVAAETRLEFFN